MVMVGWKKEKEGRLLCRLSSAGPPTPAAPWERISNACLDEINDFFKKNKKSCREDRLSGEPESEKGFASVCWGGGKSFFPPLF